MSKSAQKSFFLPKPHISWVCSEGIAIYLTKKERKIFLFGYKVNLKCLHLHRKLMFGKLQIGRIWDSSLPFFCLILHHFVHWTPAPPTLCGDVGTGKLEFHAVLYIPCNHHQKFVVLVIWPTVFPHWMELVLNLTFL